MWHIKTIAKLKELSKSEQRSMNNYLNNLIIDKYAEMQKDSI